MPVYGLEGADIDDLAATLSEVLEMRLYQQHSPMIGPWYTNLDLQAVASELKKGHQPAASTEGQSLELVLNDPEPGYTSPEFPGGGDYLLRVSGSPDAVAGIEEQLRQSGLDFKRLKE